MYTTHKIIVYKSKERKKRQIIRRDGTCGNIVLDPCMYNGRTLLLDTYIF